MHDMIKTAKWWADQKEMSWRISAVAGKRHGGTFIFVLTHASPRFHPSTRKTICFSSAAWKTGVVLTFALHWFLIICTCLLSRFLSLSITCIFLCKRKTFVINFENSKYYYHSIQSETQLFNVYIKQFSEATEKTTPMKAARWKLSAIENNKWKQHRARPNQFCLALPMPTYRNAAPTPASPQYWDRAFHFPHRELFSHLAGNSSLRRSVLQRKGERQLSHAAASATRS